MRCSLPKHTSHQSNKQKLDPFLFLSSVTASKNKEAFLFFEANKTNTLSGAESRQGELFEAINHAKYHRFKAKLYY